MKDSGKNQEWETIAPAWIKQIREGRDHMRVGLLDGPMIEACGEVSNLNVLDCGCGEGRFCRLLLKRGARSVLGLDLSKAMIDAANGLASGGDEYRVADVQNMDFLGTSRFDLAVSYLNQCDLAEFEKNSREVCRVLKPGGRFVIANLHPMRSAVGGWQRNEKGEKQHVILDRYFEEGERHWTMLGVEITNYHRSMQTYLDGFFEAGFGLERLIEPTVTPENLHRFPELDDELRVPNFIIYVLRKPQVG